MSDVLVRYRNLYLTAAEEDSSIRVHTSIIQVKPGFVAIMQHGE